ncbi:nitric oxide synthase-like protein 1, partial [Sarcoptes scabiei]
SISIGPKPIRLKNLSSTSISTDLLHHQAIQPQSCSETFCAGSLIKQSKEQITNSLLVINNNQNNHCTQNNNGTLMTNIDWNPAYDYGRSKEQILIEAKQFMEQYYASIKRLHTPSHRERLNEIENEINQTGSYQLRQTELIFGAKLGWRNAPRCIGRIQWSKLQVFDARNCKTAQEVFEAICNQIKYATNRGNLRSAITIFPQRINGREDFRIWNNQLISYAGYLIDPNETINNGEIVLNGDDKFDENNSFAKNSEKECPSMIQMNHSNPHHSNHRSDHQQSTIIGDPMNVEFTQICIKLGWKGLGTRWDILPLVISVPGEDPQLFPLSEDLVLRVPLIHPKYEWFKDLDLQWYALPAVSSMKFDVGGIEFTACPFSGWYMDTEIAARDLCDQHRYNILPDVAKHMSLDVNSNASLWKDRAVIEVNTAVLFSFQRANVTIVDHHTAAESFMKHLENENRLRGGCPADWVWVVPPISGSLTPVFHQEMLNYELKPAYRYQEPAWKTHIWKNGGLDERNSLGLSTPRKLRFKEIAKAVKFTIKATILYATETGRSEQFAKRLGQIFSHVFNVSVYCMDSYDMLHLEHETLLLCVTSTFGNGDPPENGESFAKQLQAIKVTGDTAPDLDRETISLPVTYFRYQPNNESNEAASSTLSKDDSSPQPNKPQLLSQLSQPTISSSSKSSKALQHHMSIQPSRSDDPVASSTMIDDNLQFVNHVGPLRGERITKLGQGDELCGQEQSFSEWSAEVFEQACEVFCLTDELDMNTVVRLASLKPLQWCKENVLLDPCPKSLLEEDLNKKANRIRGALHKLSNNKKVIHYKLAERYDLHDYNDDDRSDRSKENNLRPTIRVVLKIDISNSAESNEDIKSDANYYTGDHLAVYPENSIILVQSIINRLQILNNNIDPDQPVLIKIKSQHFSIDNQNTSNSSSLNSFAETSNSSSKINNDRLKETNRQDNLTKFDSDHLEPQQKWVLHDRLPFAVTLREALTRYLDITSPPTQRLLSIFSEHASDQSEANILKNLSKDSNAYETWKAKYFPNFLEILNDFSSLNPPLEFIFTQLPLLKPRHYSISSSPLVTSALQVDLTVAVIHYRTENGAEHFGVCSNFLNDIPIGHDVFAFIRSAPNFRMPKERKVPIIMIGPGTGIAPFRSFWQQRSKLMAINPATSYGEMILFFGCRYPALQLYRKEILEQVEKGVIDDYFVAYSRRPNQKKQYVQDILRKLSKKIFTKLIEQKGHIYVCGDVSMAEDVNKTLQQILQENGIEDAEMMLLKLKETLRYHEDIFGITLRTAEVTNRNRTHAATKQSFSSLI